MTGTVVRTAQALLVTGAVALTLATAQAQPLRAVPAEPAPSSTPAATPCWQGCHVEGAIAEPVTGHRHRRHHKGQPPREPRLTQPPTDTAP